MNKQDLYQEYRTLLLEGIVPFWWKHGVDREHGGVLSGMAEDGSLLSTDKYIWSQARWLWVCSALYNRIERRQEFLESAHRTYEWLIAHGQDENGHWIYRATREGKPIVGATSIYSDCFAVYGLSEFHRASGHTNALIEALRTYDEIRRRIEAPDFRQVAPYALPPGRKPHAIPMILTEVSNELAQSADDPDIEQAAGDYALIVMDRFVREEFDLLVEFLDKGYNLLPPPEGTAVMPGHAIESMWFVMHWARQRDREDVVHRAASVLRRHLEKGWDAEHGGLFLAIDAAGHTPFLANAEKKIWWPHTEALYALLLAHELTHQAWCWEWYQRVHAWSFAHFPMPEVGEWRQRLDRTGKPITELIALPVKDPFHLPRAVILILQLLRPKNANF